MSADIQHKYETNIIKMIHDHHQLTVEDDSCSSDRNDRPRVHDEHDNADDNSSNIDIDNSDDDIDSIPPYIQQLFEYYTDHKSSDICMIPSEFLKLSEQFKRLLFTEHGKYGAFLEVWKNTNHQIAIKFAHEFKWQIGLQLEQPMTGPLFCCKIVDITEKTESTQPQQLNVEECALFSPYCRASTTRNHNYGEFGLLLQRLPVNVSAIQFEYQVFCAEASYSLCVPPQKWMTVGENVAFTSFETAKVSNLPFTYNVAIKVKELRSN